jgi:hypothetical protein
LVEAMRRTLVPAGPQRKTEELQEKQSRDCAE